MHEHHDIIDVLIVGAGPTGLTLACDLARQGVSHRIIERAPAFSSASRAKTIQPRALEVLDDLGAAARVAERGVVDLPMRFHAPDGTVTDAPGIATAAADRTTTPYPDPVWIGQPDVEEALRQVLARFEGRVELASEAVGLTQDEDGVSVEVDAPGGTKTIRARYVVGADGGKSRIRKLVDLPLGGHTYEDQRWYVGDVRAEGLERDRIHIWTSPQGMFGLTPLPSTDVWQVQSPVPGDVEVPAEPSLELYQAMLDDRAGTDAVRLSEASWLSVYRVNARMVDSYRHGRVLLAGDAAHVHSPAGGQGMNTGIQDAYNLGWKLGAVLRGASSPLLNTYGEERIPIARAVLADSTRKMDRTLSSISDTGARLRSALGSISDDHTSGLPIGYPGSSLTLPDDGPRPSALRPGHRAPDATGLRGKHVGGRIFDLLRGPHFTLLAFTSPDDARELQLDGHQGAHLHVHRIGTTPAAQVHDTTGAAHRAYDTLGDELILVRPDGYIAARVPVDQEARLVAHLNAYRPPQPAAAT